MSINRGKKVKQVNIRVTEEFDSLLTAVCKKQKTSESEFIERVTRDHIQGVYGVVRELKEEGFEYDKETNTVTYVKKIDPKEIVLE